MAGRIVIFIIFWFLVACRVPNQNPSHDDNTQPTIVQQKDTLYFKKGDTLSIALLAAFNTGFLWMNEDSSTLINIIGSDFITATGQFDTMRFLLVPTFSNDTCINIDFVYKRPWEEVETNNNKLQTYIICNN